MVIRLVNIFFIWNIKLLFPEFSSNCSLTWCQGKSLTSFQKIAICFGAFIETHMLHMLLIISLLLSLSSLSPLSHLYDKRLSPWGVLEYDSCGFVAGGQHTW